jgi:hypothetical protein
MLLDPSKSEVNGERMENRTAGDSIQRELTGQRYTRVLRRPKNWLRIAYATAGPVVWGQLTSFSLLAANSLPGNAFLHFSRPDVRLSSRQSLVRFSKPNLWLCSFGRGKTGNLSRVYQIPENDAAIC